MNDISEPKSAAILSYRELNPKDRVKIDRDDVHFLPVTATHIYIHNYCV